MKPSGVTTKPEPLPAASPRRSGWRTSILTTDGLTDSAACVTACE
jgi:hypothetical protein